MCESTYREHFEAKKDLNSQNNFQVETCLGRMKDENSLN